jgi:hypothetical protein
MPNASARLGLGAALLAVAAGCSGPDFTPGDLGTRGRDMQAGPGLFSGPDGTFTIMERPIDREAEPPSLTTPPPEARSLTTPPAETPTTRNNATP